MPLGHSLHVNLTVYENIWKVKINTLFYLLCFLVGLHIVNVFYSVYIDLICFILYIECLEGPNEYGRMLIGSNVLLKAHNGPLI